MPALSGQRTPVLAAVRALVGCCHPEPTAAVAAISVALALASGRSPWGVADVGLAVLAGQLSIGWHNDWLDSERDARAGRTDKPLARGDISRPVVARAAASAALAVVPLSFLSGWRAGLAHIIAVGLALAYNARLKAGLTSFVPYVLAFPLLVVFISLGRHASRWPPWWALLGAALLGLGAHLANAAPDVAEDAVVGIKGLPQRLGARRSIECAVWSLATSTAVIGIGAGPPITSAAGQAIAVAFTVLLAALALAFWRSGRRRRQAGTVGGTLGSRTWFRAAMVVALANVALLVVRGSSL